MSAIASVVRCTATLAVFSLHNRQARSSAWLAPNSSPISQTARQFAELLVSSSRHIIVAGVSVKSFLPARPNSHANIICSGIEVTSAEHRLDAHPFYQRLRFLPNLVQILPRPLNMPVKAIRLATPLPSP